MILLSLLFTLGLVAGYQLGHIPAFFLILYGLIGTSAFILYGVDKLAAINGRRRVPEVHLHLFALLGGWPGALLAMPLFRHKIHKMPFLVIFWMVSMINATLLAGWLLLR